MKTGPLRMLIVTPFYAPAWEYGGMVRSTYGWANAIADSGIEVRVITTATNPTDVASASSGFGSRVGVVFHLRKTWGGNLFLSLSLARHCYELAPHFDIVHSVGLWNFPSGIASLFAARFHIPYIVSLHGMLMPKALAYHSSRKKIMMRLVERRRLLGASAVVCASQVEKEEYRRLRIRDNAQVISNIVDLSEAVLAPGKFRRENKLEQAFVMLFAGRLVATKGLELTLRAFSGVCEQYPRAEFVIVGPQEGDHVNVLKSLVQSLGLQSKVRFAGMLYGQAYWDAIASADLLVLNSHSENFGLVVAEALGLGVPVLISDKVGLADLVEQYETGLVTKLDVGEIRAAMCRFLRGEVDRAAMGRRGRDLVRDHFTPRSVGDRFVKLVQEVLASKGTRSAAAGV